MTTRNSREDQEEACRKPESIIGMPLAIRRLNVVIALQTPMQTVVDFDEEGGQPLQTFTMIALRICCTGEIAVRRGIRIEGFGELISILNWRLTPEVLQAYKQTYLTPNLASSITTLALPTEFPPISTSQLDCSQGNLLVRTTLWETERHQLLIESLTMIDTRHTIDREGLVVFDLRAQLQEPTIDVRDCSGQKERILMTGSMEQLMWHDHAKAREASRPRQLEWMTPPSPAGRCPVYAGCPGYSQVVEIEWGEQFIPEIFRFETDLLIEEETRSSVLQAIVPAKEQLWP